MCSFHACYHGRYTENLECRYIGLGLHLQGVKLNKKVHLSENVKDYEAPNILYG